MLVSVAFFTVGAVGLLIMLKAGFITVLLTSILEIPLLFLQGVFGIIEAVLFS